MTVKLSLDYEGAAEATGYSPDTIRRAVDNSEMVARFANSKPVIQVKELERWLESLPTEKPRKKSA